jgi:hypothetical protein
MNECIPVEELGVLARLAEDDPRRRHAALCPRCSSLLFAYEEFVRAGEVDGSQVASAEERLSRFISERVERGEPAHATRVSGAPRSGRGRGFQFSLWRTAAVAATVVMGAAAVVHWWPRAPHEVVYRGEEVAQLSGLASSRDSGGAIELRWDPVAGADSYRVTLLAEDLAEITRLDPTPSPSLRFDPASAAGARYWQVTALVEGGELLSSDPQRLP